MKAPTSLTSSQFVRLGSIPLAFQQQKMDYRPLDPSGNEIRLVILKSKTHASLQSYQYSNGTITIYCEIEHHLPSAKKNYCALSYVWGQPGDASPIRIKMLDDNELSRNDVVVHVTQNLKVALEHLQKDDEDVVLWIDVL
jgi:hypothetical protein